VQGLRALFLFPPVQGFFGPCVSVRTRDRAGVTWKVDRTASGDTTASTIKGPDQPYVLGRAGRDAGSLLDNQIPCDSMNGCGRIHAPRFLTACRVALEASAMPTDDDRNPAAILEEWRAAERELAQSPGVSPDHDVLVASVRVLAREYQTASLERTAGAATPERDRQLPTDADPGGHPVARPADAGSA
jgi:hypothetical protein